MSTARPPKAKLLYAAAKVSGVALHMVVMELKR
jgi:hypothetical protein